MKILRAVRNYRGRLGLPYVRRRGCFVSLLGIGIGGWYPPRRL